MATVTMTLSSQKITNSADTNDHDINFDAVLPGITGTRGTALIDNISGPMRYNSLGATDASLSSVYTTTDKVLMDIYKGTPLHFRGASGSETFQITILSN